MRSDALPGFLFAGLAAAAAGAQPVPLDVTDPTPRTVLVEVENSADPGVVGQSFGPPFPASWSVSGSVGRVELSAPQHEDLRVDLFGPSVVSPVSGSFDPMVIEIDLATLEVTTQPTAGVLYAQGGGFVVFATRALDTTATGGFMGPESEADPFFCPSQAYVDQLCPSILCTANTVCTLVPGSPYDPLTGKLHLVGAEDEDVCDGPCSMLYDFFALVGDLRLSEAASLPSKPVPAAAPWLQGALAALLAGAGALGAARRRRARR